MEAAPKGALTATAAIPRMTATAKYRLATKLDPPFALRLDDQCVQRMAIFYSGLGPANGAVTHIAIEYADLIFD
jgi:hypothetical protein